MTLNIDDFLKAAMLHPGATNFSIQKDKTSGKEILEAHSDLFNGTNMAWKNVCDKQSTQTRKALRRALKKRFGSKAANFAFPPRAHQLDASSITHLIKIAESTDSKNKILRESFVASSNFVLSTEYIAQLRAAGDDQNPFYHSEYKKIIKALDDYENEIAYLKIPQKLTRLAKLEVKATLLLKKQELLLREIVGIRHKKLMNQCRVTKHLIKGIEAEREMTLMKS
ncbi:MAG: hypothetical protein ACH346_07520 [Chthoniobacterales bacterium]